MAFFSFAYPANNVYICNELTESAMDIWIPSFHIAICYFVVVGIVDISQAMQAQGHTLR